MGSPTRSVTTENPEPRGKGGASCSCSRGIPATATTGIDEAYYEERPFRGPWPREVPATGVLGDMAFYYGACWLHHHSMQGRGRTR
jgi:hypothetical protein